MATLYAEDVGADLKADIAIIGAGISGLYCAWRLLQDNPKQKIVIVERLNRTGGRLDTDIIEIAPGEEVREEEGGMRFNYGMDELMNLTKALGLCDQIVDFPMASDGDTNRFTLRGRSFTVQDAKDSGQMIWSEIYSLKPEETGLSPTDLVTSAYQNVLYANGRKPKDGEPPEFWTKLRETFTWNGRRMNQWQLWGLLRDMGYSEECIEMLTETIGFAGPFKSMANAGDAFQILADFPKDPQYYTFACGFSTLPNAVAADLEKNHAANIKIILSANVDSITKSGKDFELSITKAPDEINARPIIPGGEAKRLTASKLIVAVATKGMEDLFNRSPAFREAPDAEKLWDNIHAALGMKLMKINLYFDRPWWEDEMTGRPRVQFGPNFSDLPVNAVYPFYALPEKQRIQAGEESDIRDAAAALTIYCDFNKTNFWHGLQNLGPMFSSPLQERENHRRPQTLFAASLAVVEEARKQLSALFGTNWVPEPVLTSYRLWDGEEDFEYAYHQWRLNAMDSEIRAYLSNPMAQVFFCNEAISDMHGWVNGSLRSSDLVLAHFGIGPMPTDKCTPPKKSMARVAPRRPGLWGG